MTILVLLAVLLLAWSNGANDLFKGVASLYGSGAARYRTALGWAALTTAAGSLAAIVLAAELLGKFSGKGLVPENLAGTMPFVVSVALAGGLTVLLATFLGFPISTTHALTGAMLGCGWVSAGSDVKLAVLGKNFLLPLLLSPILAVLLGALCYAVFRSLRLVCGIQKEWCFCLGLETQVVPVPQPSSLLAVPASPPAVHASCGTVMECKERYQGPFVGVNGQKMTDGAHFLSAGVVGFARGLNDTPKMAALLLAVPQMQASWAIILVMAAMIAGGLAGARKVAETMSHKITSMNPGQGFSANLGTGILVSLASLIGLPVSTTHVSVGSLIGIGLVNRRANFSVIGKVLMSWVITLPCAALMGTVAYLLIRGIGPLH